MPKRRDDFIDRAIEAQEHRYDPGYWTGGRVHPMYRASRPNKLGYLLSFFGGVIVVAGVSALDGSLSAIVMIAVGALELIAGVRLLRRRRTPTPDDE